MADLRLVYVTDIRTTPEKLWHALTSDGFWQQFSGPVKSDWKEGSPISFLWPDGKVFSVGVILASTPPHLLSFTWPDPEGKQDPESVQRLIWRIEECGTDQVRLTLLHENLTPKAYEGVSKGWPMILKDLKDQLETGTAVPSTT